MRKQLVLVITFSTTTQALYMENVAKKENMPGRIIPLPKEIDAGCGLSWATKEREPEEWESFLKDHGITYDQMCEVEI